MRLFSCLHAVHTLHSGLKGGLNMEKRNVNYTSIIDPHGQVPAISRISISQSEAHLIPRSRRTPPVEGSKVT